MAPLGYEYGNDFGNPSGFTRSTQESEVDRFNQWMRSQPWWQEIRALNPNGDFTDNQAQLVVNRLQQEGIKVPKDFKIDEGGNYNQKSRLKRNLIIAGLVGAGAVTGGMALAGAGPFAGAGAAGAAGAGGGAGTLASTTIGSGFIPAVGLGSGTALAAGSGMGAAAGGLAAALPSETVGLSGSGFGGNALAGSGFGEPLASRQVGSGAMGPVGQGRAGAPVAPSIGSSSGRLGRGIKALAGSVPAIAGLTGGDGGSPSQGLNELLQQIPQLREMLDLQLNQAKRQDPLHEAVTKMSMYLLPNSARKNYS